MSGVVLQPRWRKAACFLPGPRALPGPWRCDMAVLSYAQLKSVWLSAAKGTQYGTNAWASLMAAIAEAESGGNPAITNPNDNGGTQTSWGLWQISLGNHDEPSPNWNNPV